jgi:hypothetical protein
MHFKFEVSNAFHNISYIDSTNVENISLVAELADGDKLSIGEDYLFANAKTFTWEGKDKKEVNCNISIERDCNIENDFLKSGNIGLVAFSKEFASSDGLDFYSADIFFSIYVNDELFNKISLNISSKLFVLYLSIEVKADNDEMKYGWEPDGSHKIWNNPNENLALKSFNISFGQKGSVDNDVKFDLDEAKKENDSSIKNLYSDINTIKISLYVIAIAVLIIVTKIFS